MKTTKEQIMKKQKMYTGATPSMEAVKCYFSEKGMNEQEAEHFFMFYQMKQWRSSKGNLLTNWKPIAHGWILSANRILA